MPLALRYLGDHCVAGSGIFPWYFAGSMTLEVGAVFPVPPEGSEMVLGRGVDTNVRVASNGVARRHVRIGWTPDGALSLEDLGSTNGTQVNGLPVQKALLRVGDRITLAASFDFEVIEVA